MNLAPAQRVSPGRIIARELAARDLSLADLAIRLECSDYDAALIIRAERPIDKPLARSLAVIFDTSADLWLNLEAQWKSLHTGNVSSNG